MSALPESPADPAVFYDPTAAGGSGALFVGGLKTTDRAVIKEASRWSTGERGEPVEDLADLAGVDLSAFAREALSVGARVLSLAAQDGDTRAVRQAVKEAGEQVADVVSRASASSEDAVRRAVDTLTSTARTANQTVMDEVTRLVGGENPHLLERLQAILGTVGRDLSSQAQTAIDQATAAAREVDAQRHAELLAAVGDVRREVAVRVAADEAATDATAAVTSVTTLKGFAYEDQINIVLTDIAADVGEEYRATGEFAGRLPRNKKGDGVFKVSGGMASVVIECHDGTSKDWGSYLAEAERNRGAQAAVGLIRHVADNAGRVVRVVAPKRLVVAFDPENDDVEMLRTIMLLMRTVALTSSGRFGTEEIATANEHLREALSILDDLDDVKRSASAITGHATKIEQIATKTMTAIQREVNGALNALTGAAVTGPDDAPEERPPGSDPGPAGDPDADAAEDPAA